MKYIVSIDLNPSGYEAESLEGAISYAISSSRDRTNHVFEMSHDEAGNESGTIVAIAAQSRLYRPEQAI